MEQASLLQNSPNSELDYVYLLDHLSDYASPRDKITALLKDGDILRVKKGLYVLSSRYGKTFSPEILSNLIYGPSYVSMDYALMFHGMIPEKVTELTGVTSKKNKTFETPVGLFTYRYLNQDRYPVGVTRLAVGDGRFAFMATREKALADKLWFSGPSSLDDEAALKEYLFDDLRISESVVKTFNKTLLRKIARAYARPAISLLENLR